MKFTVTSVVAVLAAPALALASVVPSAKRSCDEASRFGDITITPTTLKAGDSYTVKADYTCAIAYGKVPSEIDYYLEVPVNNTGFESPILLATRSSPVTVVDEFTGTVPYGFFNADSSYFVNMQMTYPINGTNGSPVYVTGGVLKPVTMLLN